MYIQNDCIVVELILRCKYTKRKLAKVMSWYNICSDVDVLLNFTF